MTYPAAIWTVIAATFAAILATAIVQRVVTIEFRRRHHDVGSVVFLQIGVVFAVLLAFVFSEAWSEYNEAAQSIDLEVGALHGTAMIAATLPEPQGATILAAEQAYLVSVIVHEWPVMASRRTEDPITDGHLATLLMSAANLRLDQLVDSGKKGEIMSLLAEAHQQRETRIFQCQSGIPAALWSVLIAFTLMLALFVAFSGIEHRGTSAAMSACFAASIVSILVVARLLDYPFEGAIALHSGDFVGVLGKITNLINHVPLLPAGAGNTG